MAQSTVNAKTVIQDQVSTMLVEPLEAASVVLAARPTIFDSSEPLRIPTLEAGVDPEWTAENALIAEDEATFGEIALMPSDRKSIKVITRVSNELIRAAKIGVSTVLEQRLVKDVQNKLDTALLVGDGVDKSVTGIFNQAGTTSVEGALDAPDTFLDALAAAASNEVSPTRFFINGGDFFKLRKVKDADGRYLIQDSLAENVKYQLFGIPVSVSNKVPAGKAALVDMAQVAVVRDIDPQVTVLTERYAEFDQVGIRVVTRYDLGLLHPEGVTIIQPAGA